MGISAAIPMLLVERKVSMSVQGKFSFAVGLFLKVVMGPNCRRSVYDIMGPAKDVVGAISIAYRFRNDI